MWWLLLILVFSCLGATLSPPYNSSSHGSGLNGTIQGMGSNGSINLNATFLNFTAINAPDPFYKDLKCDLDPSIVVSGGWHWLPDSAGYACHTYETIGDYLHGTTCCYAACNPKTKPGDPVPKEPEIWGMPILYPSGNCTGQPVTVFGDTHKLTLETCACSTPFSTETLDVDARGDDQKKLTLKLPVRDERLCREWHDHVWNLVKMENLDTFVARQPIPQGDTAMALVLTVVELTNLNTMYNDDTPVESFWHAIIANCVGVTFPTDVQDFKMWWDLVIRYASGRGLKLGPRHPIQPTTTTIKNPVFTFGESQSVRSTPPTSAAPPPTTVQPSAPSSKTGLPASPFPPLSTSTYSSTPPPATSSSPPPVASTSTSAIPVVCGPGTTPAEKFVTKNGEIFGVCRNVDFFGADLAEKDNIKSANDCAEECSQFPTCVAASYLKENGKCFLKAVFGTIQANSGVDCVWQMSGPTSTSSPPSASSPSSSFSVSASVSSTASTVASSQPPLTQSSSIPPSSTTASITPVATSMTNSAVSSPPAAPVSGTASFVSTSTTTDANGLPLIFGIPPFGAPPVPLPAPVVDPVPGPPPPAQSAPKLSDQLPSSSPPSHSSSPSSTVTSSSQSSATETSSSQTSSTQTSSSTLTSSDHDTHSSSSTSVSTVSSSAESSRSSMESSSSTLTSSKSDVSSSSTGENSASLSTESARSSMESSSSTMSSSKVESSSSNTSPSTVSSSTQSATSSAASSSTFTSSEMETSSSSRGNSSISLSTQSTSSSMESSSSQSSSFLSSSSMSSSSKLDSSSTLTNSSSTEIRNTTMITVSTIRTTTHWVNSTSMADTMSSTPSPAPKYTNSTMPVQTTMDENSSMISSASASTTTAFDGCGYNDLSNEEFEYIDGDLFSEVNFGVMNGMVNIISTGGCQVIQGTSHYTVFETFIYGNMQTTITLTCPPSRGQACAHYYSAMSRKRGVPGWEEQYCTPSLMTLPPQHIREGNRGNGQAWTDWNRQHLSMWATSTWRVNARCDRDEWPPLYFLDERNPIRTNGEQLIRFLDAGNNRGAGQTWNGFCTKRAASLLKNVRGGRWDTFPNSVTTESYTRHAGDPWSTRVFTLAWMSIPWQPVFTLEIAPQRLLQQPDLGLAENDCLPVGLLEDTNMVRADPGFALLSNDPWNQGRYQQSSWSYDQPIPPAQLAAAHIYH